MNATPRLCCTVCCWGAVLCAVPAVPATASEEGEFAASLVKVEHYRHFLDDMLYTHEGDNRSILGVEHDLARANIADLFESFGLAVALEAFAFDWDDDGNDETYYNVVATKLGTTYPDQEYVVGAHYDSGDPWGDGVYPGADDNASGVALLLEAARVLRLYDSDYTIRFVAFDVEEWGLYGSMAYVIDHVADDILGMISADMVAYNRGTNSVEIYARTESHTIETALGAAVDTYGDGLTWSPSGYCRCSDHWAFEEVGIPACLLIEAWSNPYFHEPTDHVDMPDYIDYEYAVRITRSVVGYLVDHAGVAVTVPNADYDGDGDVDIDDYSEFLRCLTGPGIPPDNPACNFFDLDLDGDVDCLDWELFLAVWTEPDDPPNAQTCNPEPPIVAGGGSHCLTVTPPGSEWPAALLVTGDPDDSGVSCVSGYVQPGGRLGADPAFQESDVWGTVLVCDDQILPETLYLVQCDFGQPGVPILSPGSVAEGGPWGDTAGDFVGSQWTPPNGTVDFNDITAVVDAFRSLPTAPPVYFVDLIGSVGYECRLDRAIDFGDISAAVDGFRGYTYWQSTQCASPCD